MNKRRPNLLRFIQPSPLKQSTKPADDDTSQHDNNKDDDDDNRDRQQANGTNEEDGDEGRRCTCNRSDPSDQCKFSDGKPGQKPKRRTQPATTGRTGSEGQEAHQENREDVNGRKGAEETADDKNPEAGAGEGGCGGKTNRTRTPTREQEEATSQLQVSSIAVFVNPPTNCPLILDGTSTSRSRTFTRIWESPSMLSRWSTHLLRTCSSALPARPVSCAKSTTRSRRSPLVKSKRPSGLLLAMLV